MKALGWLLVLLGISSNQTPVTVISPMPVAGTVTAHIAPPDTGPQAWQVSWQYPHTNAVEFEVWSSVDLRVWSLARTTTNREAIFLGKPMEFFRVRAKDPVTLQYSGWATTK